jgi:hypothetical protein
LFRISVRASLQCLARFNEASRPDCRVTFFHAEREISSVSRRSSRNCRRSTGRRKAGPALGRIKRQEQGWIARGPGLAPRAIACEARGNLDAPGIRARIRIRTKVRFSVRINVRFRGRGFCNGDGVGRPLHSIGGAEVAWNSGIAAGRTVRQSGRHQSGIHHSGGHKSGRRKQVAKNASSPSQARHDLRRPQK